MLQTSKAIGKMTVMECLILPLKLQPSLGVNFIIKF